MGMKPGLSVVFSASILSVSGTASAQQATGEITVPPQCLEKPSEQGMPVSYHRESMIDQPVLMFRQDPHYPVQPSETRDFYCASFMFSVGADGRVNNVETLYDSHPGIDGMQFGQLARAALDSWQFQPGMIDKAPAEFIGFSAVFYQGFGDKADLARLRKEAGTATHIANDISKDWQSYGRRVTQSELELLEEAADSRMAPDLARKVVKAKPQKPKVTVPTSWIVAEDGTVMTDQRIYKPGETLPDVPPEPVEVQEPAAMSWDTDALTTDIAGTVEAAGARHAESYTTGSDESSETSGSRSYGSSYTSGDAVYQSETVTSGEPAYGVVSEPFYEDGTPVNQPGQTRSYSESTYSDYGSPGSDGWKGDASSSASEDENAAILDAFGVNEASESDNSFPPLL